MKVVFRLS